MRSLFLLHFLLATYIVSIHADDPFTNDRNGVVTATSATTTSTSASSTASSSQSTLTASTTSASTTSASTTSASTTSATTLSTSASSASTSSAASNAFQWDGSEIAALVILLGFFVFGTAFIAAWQVRRMAARRRDNATLGAYAKHQRNPSVETDFTKADEMKAVNPQTEHSPDSPSPAFQYANDDLERQPYDVPAASFRNLTPALPGPSIYVSPQNSIWYSRSPSPYSEAAVSPTSQSSQRRLFSFEELPRSTIGGSLAGKVDRMAALSSNSASAPWSSSSTQM